MIEAFIFLFAVVLVWGFSKWRNLRKLEQLREWIYWASSKNNNARYSMSLLQHFKNEQIKAKIPDPYRVSGDEEWEFVEKILKEYQLDLMYAFFEGRAAIIKDKLSVNENCNTSYFVFSLYIFLCDHQCDYKFCGEEMHSKTIEHNSYGVWGHPLFDATYALTDFAIVFHKMMYVTYMAAKGNGLLKDFLPSWKEENLKENLDTQTIQISRR